MSEPENINANQYHISQQDFVQVDHLKIKLPNGQINNFDWEKTYIINAVNANGQIIDFSDTDTQYQPYYDSQENKQSIQFRKIATSNDGNPKGDVYSIHVFDIRNRFIEGNNITITPQAYPNTTNPEYYKLVIKANDTKYQADGITLSGYVENDKNKFSLIYPKIAGQILSSNSNKVPIWVTPNWSTSNTTYTDGRYIDVVATGDNPHAINCTLSADNRTIQISGANDTKGIIEVKPGNFGQILSTTNVGDDENPILSAIWTNPKYSTSDSTYSLYNNITTNNGDVSVILKKDGIDQDQIFLSGSGATTVKSESKKIIINSTDHQYWADDSEDDPSTLILGNNGIKFSVYNISSRLIQGAGISITQKASDNGKTTIGIDTTGADEDNNTLHWNNTTSTIFWGPDKTFTGSSGPTYDLSSELEDTNKVKIVLKGSDDSTDNVYLVGSGGTTVSKDDDGNIAIYSTDQNDHYLAYLKVNMDGYSNTTINDNIPNISVGYPVSIALVDGGNRTSKLNLSGNDITFSYTDNTSTLFINNVHFNTHLYAGSGNIIGNNTIPVSAGNGLAYLKLFDDNNYRNRIGIKGKQGLIDVRSEVISDEGNIIVDIHPTNASDYVLKTLSSYTDPNDPTSEIYYHVEWAPEGVSQSILDGLKYSGRRFIYVDGQTIDCTLSADDKTITIQSNDDQKTGIIKVKPGNNDGQILSTTTVTITNENNKEIQILSAGWVTYNDIDTTYTDGRYIKVGTTKVNGSYPISSTLSADGVITHISGANTTKGIIVLSSSTSGQILSTGTDKKATWVNVPTNWINEDHYTSYLNIGTSGSLTNTSTNFNQNTYLKITDGNKNTSNILLSGIGVVFNSDQNGILTLSSSNGTLYNLSSSLESNNKAKITLKGSNNHTDNVYLVGTNNISITSDDTNEITLTGPDLTNYKTTWYWDDDHIEDNDATNSNYNTINQKRYWIESKYTPVTKIKPNPKQLTLPGSDNAYHRISLIALNRVLTVVPGTNTNYPIYIASPVLTTVTVNNNPVVSTVVESMNSYTIPPFAQTKFYYYKLTNNKCWVAATDRYRLSAGTGVNLDYSFDTNVVTISKDNDNIVPSTGLDWANTLSSSIKLKVPTSPLSGLAIIKNGEISQIINFAPTDSVYVLTGCGQNIGWAPVSQCEE